MRELGLKECTLIPHFKDRKSAMATLLPKRAVGVELGVMRGNNSANMVEATDPERLFLVDPWPGNDKRYQNILGRFAADPRIEVIRNTSKEALPKLPSEIDWYEEDTACGFDVMYDNIVDYDKKLRFGGVAFLDYCNPALRSVHLERYVAVKKWLIHNEKYICIGYVDCTDSIVLKKYDIKTVADVRANAYKTLPQNGVGLEIGVLLGDNAQALLDMAHPKKLYLVDCWDANFMGYHMSLREKGIAYVGGRDDSDVPAYRFVAERFKDNPAVEIMRGYSTTEVPKIADKSLDWVYIDGNHTYDGVKTDLSLVLPKMKDSCVIAGHDWTHISFGGVIFATREFLHNHPDFKMEGLTTERWCKSFFLGRG